MIQVSSFIIRNNFFFIFDFKVWLLLGWLLLIFNLNKTPLGETGCLSNPYLLLTGCLDIQFFNSPPFPAQSVRLPLVTYPSLCSTCVTYRTPCHAIGHQVLSTQPLPREAEDFPRGGTSAHTPSLVATNYLIIRG